MVTSAGTGIMDGRGNLSHRIGLTALLLIQVTLVPIIGFSLTYLLDIDRENFAVSIRTELIYWIIIAGLVYGITSFFLALLIGGYRPSTVVTRGGWLPTLGLSRRKYDPELIDRARMSAYSSPFGRMTRMVSERIADEEYDLISVHGGLQLLAVPSQILLISIPLLIMEGIPDNLLQPDSAFELGMAGYLIALWFAFRVQPLISRRLVGIAAMFRKILWRITKISWILPVVIFWGAARIMLALALTWLGVDISQWHDVQLEAVILHFVAPEAEIPETAVIDFLVAISVLPMATFTTICVLGGSNGLQPWMENKENKLENLTNQSLPAPSGSKSIKIQEEEDLFEIPELSESISQENTQEKEDVDESNRMIDLPFNIFDD